MNKALFIVSLQHELAMAIGNELDLKAMLKTFLKVCFSRLNLTSAHVYINQDSAGTAAPINEKRGAHIVHLLSVPKNKKGDLWQNNALLIEFSNKVIKQQLDLVFQDEHKHYFYGFVLPEYGILVFETKFEIESSIQRALKPILKKLASSCYTSIVYDSLVQESLARQRAERQVNYHAKHDGLTGLFNRQHFNALLEKSFTHAQVTKSFGAVIFMDLNRFKPINDAMGHAVGDSILVELAKRLNSIRAINVDVARFGGDEFILLISDLPANNDKSIEQVKIIIKQINQKLSKDFYIDTGSYKLSCSLGYALFPEQVTAIEDVISFADIAMYEAKRAEISGGVLYQNIMSEKINNRLAYIDEMKKGLINNEFSLYYQAQYNHAGEVIGAEALLRWQHPQRGMESPAQYIPIAEESDLILEIGSWVLEQACRDIRKLEVLGLPETFKNISINVSAKQLIQNDFKEKVLSNIANNTILAEHLALELTETILVESFEESIKLIEELKYYGIECSIDDFGTGYSSLTYLKRIPASVLKIDRSFVTNIDQESEGAAIAKMIIALGHTLNMDVLAEGVETEKELNSLRSLGCYQYQGFYFSKPVPLPQFIELLFSNKS